MKITRRKFLIGSGLAALAAMGCKDKHDPYIPPPPITEEEAMVIIRDK